ncbi:hypothetical protein GN958_ATG18278 [Phytophthora infestans]|uniref:Uncharacterized protein n=1 Tax=Phytophthora infestans TaxID=4787 RepID=A0A8S9U2X4_PHYIN|nr:hypothetical protein GN958_ATG18278 [Phytophthora infestans]
MEVPPHIQRFRQLREVFVYNTTLVEWNASAALSSIHHPKWGSVTIARSNMTDGVLPLGLQSPEFPHTVFGVYLVETNLRSLPDDLDSKWPSCAVYIENSLLTAVPPSLMRLRPQTLSLDGNPIQAVPRELFEIGIIQYTSLSRTLLRELPQNVSFLLSYATQLELMDTRISFFGRG